MQIFQSTPPVWGATKPRFMLVHSVSISIHAPRVGGDFMYDEQNNEVFISIHAPRVGGDGKNS